MSSTLSCADNGNGADSTVLGVGQRIHAPGPGPGPGLLPGLRATQPGSAGNAAVPGATAGLPPAEACSDCRAGPAGRAQGGRIGGRKKVTVVSFCAVVCVLSCCRAVLTRVSVVRRAVLSCVSCVSVVPSCGAVVSLRARAVPVPCLR